MNLRNNYLLRKYGITSDQYNELLELQDHRCAVCKKSASSFKSKLCVDHDHHSGHVRGLLCIYCNRRIVGRHRRTSGADLLKAAYEYLVKEYPGWIVPKKKKKNVRKRRKTLLSRR